MDALKMAAVDLADAPPESEGPVTLETSRLDLAPRLLSALVALLEARDYARELEANPWDFAIELSSLRRLQLSNSDLRWLVVRRLIEHGVEVTLGGDSQRSFRRPGRLVFGKRTCFVLTDAGAELAQRHSSGERRPRPELTRALSKRRVLGVVPAPGRAVPKWDRDRQELRLGATVVKQFKIPSFSQVTILAAFEEKSWPPRIDDPLSAGSEPFARPCLRETIELLNKHQRAPLICFREDAGGQGVLWELRGDQTASRKVGSTP